MRTIEGRPAAGAPEAPRRSYWMDFLAWEERAAAQGSGMTAEQKAGAAMFRSWLINEADDVATLQAILRMVDEAIFDLPIGEDVSYSRGYSAGIAAARESFRDRLRAALSSAEPTPTEGRQP